MGEGEEDIRSSCVRRISKWNDWIRKRYTSKAIKILEEYLGLFDQIKSVFSFTLGKIQVNYMRQMGKEEKFSNLARVEPELEKISAIQEGVEEDVMIVEQKEGIEFQAIKQEDTSMIEHNNA